MNREIEQVKNLGFSVINEFDKMADIQAVLKLISICKKVITVDSAVVHFAGALGIDT